MSDYDEPRRYRNTRTRPRDYNDPDYMEETTYVERGKGRPPRDLIPRDDPDYVEDIQRDFPPPERRRPRGYDDYGEPPRRARSAAGRRSGYYDDRYDDYYEEDDYYGQRSRGRRDDYRRRDGYYSDEDRSPPREKKKSGVEGLLEGLGLGGAAGALLGNKKSDRDRSRSRRGSGDSRYDRDRSGSRPRGEKRQRQWAQAAQAALVAGAVEAFKSRGEPGGWVSGEKGKRIATAAIAAGGIDRVVDRDPDKKSHRHLAEAVVGGLAATRLANGARSKSRDGRGRSRSRSVSRSIRSRSRSIIDKIRGQSRGRSGSAGSERGGGGNHVVRDVAAGGALAAAGKAIYDRVRSKSRKRRSPSSGSEDSYVPSRSRRRDRDVGDNSGSRGMGPDETAVVGPQRGSGALATTGGQAPNKEDDSSSDTSATEVENQRKRMRGKELLTAGLATVATIHAAHGIYNTMEGSKKRHQMVVTGQMSPEEARKKKTKAWLQDAAAVGIAALGIKGAYSEWKEMNEQRHTVKELEERRKAKQERLERRRREGSSRHNGGGGGGGGGGGPYMSGGAGGDPYNNGNLPPPPPMGYGR